MNLVVSWNFWLGAAWVTINNVCWDTPTIQLSPNWTFTTYADAGQNCSLISIASPTWYNCTVTTNWPSNLTANVSNIAWNCVLNKCDFWAGSWYLDCILY
jgi:hypothetical protein